MSFELAFISKTEMIIKDLNKKKVFSLHFPYSNTCSICFSPLGKKEQCDRHPGLTMVQDFKLICGGYYHVSKSDRPLDWWTEIVWKISELPFQYSSKIIEFVMSEKLKFFQCIQSPMIATMIPTKSYQMKEVYQNIANFLSIPFYPATSFFITLSNPYQKSRKDYIFKKYAIKSDIPIIFPRNVTILLFDDIMHTGYTIGYCSHLLQKKYHCNLVICPLSRTYGQKRKKLLLYPKK